MLKSAIRPLIFLLSLFLGFWIGWEFLLAFFIFLVASEKYFVEYVFIGSIFDTIFSFPVGLFTVIFSVVLALAYLSNDFLKSDSFFLKSSRALIFCLIGVGIYSIVYFQVYWPGIVEIFKFSAIALTEIFAISLLLLLLSDIIKIFFGPKEIY